MRAGRRSPRAIELTTDGTHTVLVRATDAGGNVSAETQVAVKIDATAPTVSGAIDRRTKRFAITATDATSGVDTIEYRYFLQVGKRTYYDEWRTYRSPLLVGLGIILKVEYRATDAAGNVSAAKVYRD